MSAVVKHVVHLRSVLCYVGDSFTYKHCCQSQGSSTQPGQPLWLNVATHS